MDDVTEMSAVYFLKNKSEVRTALRSYRSLVDNQSRWKIYGVGSDKAGKHVRNASHDFILVNGMFLEYSTPYTGQKNGSSERLTK